MNALVVARVAVVRCLGGRRLLTGLRSLAALARSGGERPRDVPGVAGGLSSSERKGGHLWGRWVVGSLGRRQRRLNLQDMADGAVLYQRCPHALTGIALPCFWARRHRHRAPATSSRTSV